MDSLEPEEPKTQEILVPIASTPAINRPLAAAAHYSQIANSRGGCAEGQKEDCAASSDESEDDDDDDPLVVIDKPKKSSFTRELASLDEILGSASAAPAGSHRRRTRTDHRHRRSDPLEIDSAAADWPVHADAPDIVLQIRCDFGDGILSLRVFWEYNRFRGAPGLVTLRRSSGLGWLLGRSSALFISVSFMVQTYGRDTALEECRADFECGHHVVLGLRGKAASTLLLVYVSNRWIDKSIYTSPIWQLHYNLTYASLCARIGPTGHSKKFPRDQQHQQWEIHLLTLILWHDWKTYPYSDYKLTL